MINNHRLWVGLPLLVGVVSCVASVSTAARRPPPPALRLSGPVDLGEQEFGRELLVPVRMANGGGADLVVNSVRTNCACAALEAVQGEQRVRVESLRLGAGEGAELSLRITTRGLIGRPMETVATFATNDPARPSGEIRVSISNVTGGVVAAPTSALFGEVAVGEERRHVVEIYDPADAVRPLTAVSATPADSVAVRFLPLPPDSPTERTDRGVLAGRVEVTFKPATLGKVAGVVKLSVGGNRPRVDEFRVIGEAVSAVDASPAAMVLPRRSGAGLLYAAEWRCRSRSGSPLKLDILSVPESVRADLVADPQDPSSALVRITAGARPAGQAPFSGAVKYRAQAGDRTTTGEIPITINPE